MLDLQGTDERKAIEKEYLFKLIKLFAKLEAIKIRVKAAQKPLKPKKTLI